MADCGLLTFKRLDEFKDWLTSKGWNIVETKGYYEVLRATKEGHAPLIFYEKSTARVHVTVPDGEASRLVWRFIKETRRS